MTTARGQNPSTIRLNNLRLMLDTIRHQQEITIPELAHQVKLSKTTVWKTIDYFLQKKMVIHAGKADSSDEGGKKPDLFKFNNNFGYVITIAIHGKYIAGAIADALGTIFEQEKVIIAENEPLPQVIAIVVELIKRWQSPISGKLRNMKLLGIVLAVSGVVDSQHGKSLTASRFKSWPPGAPLLQMIEQEVPFAAPCYIDNYNRFSTYAEKAVGGFSQYQDILMVICTDNGLGGGIISEDLLQQGKNYLTGEIGHMCINPQDEEFCHCGGRGCFEQEVAIDRLLNRAEQLSPEYPYSPLNSLGRISLQDIFDGANSQDELCCHLLDEVIRWFAIGLQNAMLVFDPELILIGGAYRTAGPYFIDHLSEQLQHVSLTSMRKDVHIEYSTFGPEGVLIGGAHYVLNTYFETNHDY